MYRMMFAVLAMAVAPASVAQTSARQPSNSALPDYPAQVSTHFAWADVLRVEPVYAMLAVQQNGPCHGELGEIPMSADVDVVDDSSTVSLGAASGRVTKNAGLVDPGVPTLTAPVADCGEVARVYEGRRIDGYDVEYRYRGEVYLSRLDYDPGERLRVRVSVSPAN